MDGIAGSPRVGPGQNPGDEHQIANSPDPQVDLRASLRVPGCSEQRKRGKTLMSDHSRPFDHSSHPRQNGSVLIILLVMVIGAGSMAMAHLTKVVAEGKKVRSRVYSERVLGAKLVTP